MTAFENVMLGVNQVYFTASRAERREIAEYYLTVVGLGEAMHKRPAELSQGMRQRSGIARAFALQPKMLLLDEPFGMLDSLTRIELQAVLLDLWRRFGITALMVTHDVDEAIFLSDRVVMMTDGPEAEVGDVLRIPFQRPRERAAIMAEAAYHDLRHELISFLSDRARPSPEPRSRSETQHRIETRDRPGGRRLRPGRLTIRKPKSPWHTHQPSRLPAHTWMDN